jgi:hypothetical protein
MKNKYLQRICAECGTRFELIDSRGTDSGPTHGICNLCWISKRSPKYHNEQLSKGYEPCFGSGSEGMCKFDRTAAGYVHRCYYRPSCCGPRNALIDLSEMLAASGVPHEAVNRAHQTMC